MAADLRGVFGNLAVTCNDIMPSGDTKQIHELSGFAAEIIELTSITFMAKPISSQSGLRRSSEQICELCRVAHAHLFQDVGAVVVYRLDADL